MENSFTQNKSIFNAHEVNANCTMPKRKLKKLNNNKLSIFFTIHKNTTMHTTIYQKFLCYEFEKKVK
jgi:hypothetical protein